MMILICSYCGSECSERDKASGRCGSCACFFTGNEEVIVREEEVSQGTQTRPVAVNENAVSASVPAIATKKAVSESAAGLGDTPSGDVSNQGDAPQLFDPSAIEPDLPPSAISNSEGLIQPRKLSPQFRRRVERTWESTFSGSSHSAEHTLSSGGSSTETKSESPTLSIATRRVSRANGNSGNATDDDYELKEVIGEGSMGRVWSARQTSLDRSVAVKVPMAELAGSGSVGESQFISEVVVTGQLEHPNIVPIYELGRDSSGVPFYSMKHVQGRPWNEFIDDQSDQENIEILMKVCDAIAFAHDRNFLHRDIKPHNVMVGEFGEVSVMDWGIAVSITKDPNQPWASVATGPAGTPAYMAPEMAAHNPSELGVVSDIYLLGAVLYEMVTGTPPHPRTGDTGAALLAAAANEIIPTDRSGELVDIARRAMATNLNDRYQSVQELQDALREYQSHRESIQLSESADQHFANAMEQGSSDEFARARFAYEEAMKLWDGNTSAVGGMRLATLAHARNSLAQDNYELGIAVLDPENPEHRELHGKLQNKRAARQRLAWVSKIAAGIAIVALLVVAWFAYAAKTTAQRNLVEKEKNLKTEIDLKDKAEDARKEAVELQRAANDMRRQAEFSAKSARSEKLKAQGAEAAARLATRRAQEAPYASEIGLAAEKIRQNLFNKARPILFKLDPSEFDATDPDQALDPVMAKLRHIEWGLLRRAIDLPSTRDLVTGVQIEAVGSSIDGSTVAAASEKGQVMLWREIDWDQVDWSDGPPARTTSDLELGSRVSAMAVSRDGRFVATAGTAARPSSGDPERLVNDVTIWRVDNNEFHSHMVLREAHKAEVLSIAFSHDGNHVVTSGADRTAIAWDVTDGKRLFTMPDHSDRQVWSARFSPDALDVVTACNDGRVRVWLAPKTNANAAEIPEARKVADFRGHVGPVYAAVFSPDGRTVISGGYDKRLLRWKLPKAGDGTSRSNAANVQARIAGDRVDAVDGEQIGLDEQQHQASIRAISVSERGILTGGNDNTVRIWASSNDGWTFQKSLRGHGRWVRGCVFSDDGKSVLSGAYDGIKRWDWNAYAMPRVLIPNPEVRLGQQPSELGLSEATRAKYSRDGRWVATAYANGNVEVWDLQDPRQSKGQPLVDGHSVLTTTGMFYDSGKRLLTSACDNTTRIWDAIRGTQLQTLEGTGYRGKASVFMRPDGSALVVTGSDNRLMPVQFWHVRTGFQTDSQPLLVDVALSLLPQRFRKFAGESIPGNQDSSVEMDDVDFDRLQRLQRGLPDATTILFSPNGEHFIVGSSNGSCHVFRVDPESAKPGVPISILAHGSAVTCAAFLPSGDSFITASAEGEIRQWDTFSGSPIRQSLLPGPVTALAISRTSKGDELLVGYAPIEDADVPIAQRFELTGDGFKPIAKPLMQELMDASGAGKSPTVQSVQFGPKTDAAMISLFFPGSQDDRRGAPSDSESLTGYRIGYWNWSGSASTFEPLAPSDFGEVASASYGQDVSGSRLLVVGGKGAKLWSSPNKNQTTFTRLTKSFRPATKICSLDFSYGSGKSERLVVGDSEGNVRVWELDGDRWSESSGAAVHLSGEHSDAVVSAQFDPTDPNRMITADRQGPWKIWSFDRANQTWELTRSAPAEQNVGGYNLAMFSPDGQRILAGTNSKGMIWNQHANGNWELDPVELSAGKVAFATFSPDASWIVTSDGERLVTFWDARGEQLDQLDQATGIKAMALSSDRRRFVTAQEDRIVIWDTSRLRDQRRRQESGLEDAIRELLTLETDSDVNSITFSPLGRSLLSCEREGRTIIWSGSPITPVSLSFASDQIDYQRGAGPKKIGELAVLRDPSQITDFSDSVMEVQIRENRVPGSEFQVRTTYDPDSSDLSQGTIEMLGNELHYRAHLDAEPVHVGSLDGNVSGASTLQVMLTSETDADAIQAVIRAIQYRIAPSPLSSIGEGGAEESTDSSQEVLITISDVRYDTESAAQTISETLTINVSDPSI